MIKVGMKVRVPSKEELLEQGWVFNRGYDGADTISYLYKRHPDDLAHSVINVRDAGRECEITCKDRTCTYINTRHWVHESFVLPWLHGRNDLFRFKKGS